MLTKEELATIRLPEGCDWVRPNGVGKWFTHYPYTHGQTDRAISAVAEAEANGHLPRGATAAIWAMVETGKVPVDVPRCGTCKWYCHHACSMLKEVRTIRGFCHEHEVKG